MTARIDLIHNLVPSAAAAAPERAAIIAADGAVTTFADFDRQIAAVSPPSRPTCCAAPWHAWTPGSTRATG